jgi:hypothetical protein
MALIIASSMASPIFKLNITFKLNLIITNNSNLTLAFW